MSSVPSDRELDGPEPSVMAAFLDGGAGVLNQRIGPIASSRIVVQVWPPPSNRGGQNVQHVAWSRGAARSCG